MAPIGAGCAAPGAGRRGALPAPMKTARFGRTAAANGPLRGEVSFGRSRNGRRPATNGRNARDCAACTDGHGLSPVQTQSPFSFLAINSTGRQASCKLQHTQSASLAVLSRSAAPTAAACTARTRVRFQRPPRPLPADMVELTAPVPTIALLAPRGSMQGSEAKQRKASVPRTRCIFRRVRGRPFNSQTNWRVDEMEHERESQSSPACSSSSSAL